MFSRAFTSWEMVWNYESIWLNHKVCTSIVVCCKSSDDQLLLKILGELAPGAIEDATLSKGKHFKEGLMGTRQTLSFQHQSLNKVEVSAARFHDNKKFNSTAGALVVLAV